jgi:hypothetical protein
LLAPITDICINDPTTAKPSADKELPSLTNDRTESELPSVVANRADTLLARVVPSCTYKVFLRTPAPADEIPSPVHTPGVTERTAPILTKSAQETDAPKLTAENTELIDKSAVTILEVTDRVLPSLTNELVDNELLQTADPATFKS